uniref:Uncharacterized protein n=1 Tax=Stomoxys calcitrans TaxID=35570 RepID=A0A1I8Q6R0_STOCA
MSLILNVNPKYIILPPLHIKLGLIKQFVKGFPRISSGKLNQGILYGPQIRKLVKDDKFIQKIKLEKKAWNGIV